MRALRREDMQTSASILSMCFFSFAFSGLSGFAYIPIIYWERSVFYQEQASNTYRPLAYLFIFIII